MWFAPTRGWNNDDGHHRRSRRLHWVRMLIWAELTQSISITARVFDAFQRITSATITSLPVWENNLHFNIFRCRLTLHLDGSTKISISNTSDNAGLRHLALDQIVRLENFDYLTGTQNAVIIDGPSLAQPEPAIKTKSIHVRQCLNLVRAKW